MSAPITVDEMAGIVYRIVDQVFSGIPETPHDGAFELTAPATGQRFRIVVTEVAGWSDRMDRELAEVTREATP